MGVNGSWAVRAALEIGERLLASAIPVGDGATWEVSEVVAGSHPTETERRRAGGTVYRGTAGISLFLTELGRLTGHGDLLDCSRLALEHAFGEHRAAVETHRRLGTGLYSGVAGLPFTAAAYLRCRSDGELRADATSAIELLAELAEKDRSYDLLAGGAGAVVALLGVTDVFGQDAVLPVAERFGDHLLANAVVEPVGLSWPSGGLRGANLCGLAHGAAGIGWALLELHAHTGRECFRLAAEEAFAYEDLRFHPEASNWEDLRNGTLTRLQRTGRLDEVDALVRDGGPLPVYTRKFMTAWCHGAPGIGLVRGRACRLLGREEQRRRTRAAARRTLASLDPTEVTNHSVCHGFMGNALAYMSMARSLGLEGAAEAVLDQVRTTAATVGEGRSRWIPGGADRLGFDPTLLMGEAGIGLGLLALEHEVVDVSLPVPAPPPAHPVPARDSKAVRRKIALQAFPGTTGSLPPEDLEDLLELPPEGGERRPGSFVPTRERLLERLSSRARGNERLGRALERDLIVLESARHGFDRALVRLAQLIPTRPEEEPVGLAPWVRIVDRGHGTLLVVPDAEGRWSARPIAPAMAALLDVLREPSTVKCAAAALAEAAGGEEHAVRRWAHDQVVELVPAGVVIAGRLATALRRSMQPEVAQNEAEEVSSPGNIAADPSVRGHVRRTGGAVPQSLAKNRISTGELS
jgi:hypothetical protein